LLSFVTRPVAGCVPGLACAATFSKAGRCAGAVTRRW